MLRHCGYAISQVCNFELRSIELQSRPLLVGSGTATKANFQIWEPKRDVNPLDCVYNVIVRTLALTVSSVVSFLQCCYISSVSIEMVNTSWEKNYTLIFFLWISAHTHEHSFKQACVWNQLSPQPLTTCTLHFIFSSWAMVHSLCIHVSVFSPF